MTERQAMWSGRLCLRAIGQYLIASAVGHLLWEIVQLPLYTIGQTGTTAIKAFAVIHCTGGDIVIALWTLLAALLVTVSTDWPRSRFMIVALVTTGIGLMFTGYSEWQNVYVKQSWAYTATMPTIAIAGLTIGLAPLAQCIIVPGLVFWRLHRRHLT